VKVLNKLLISPDAIVTYEPFRVNLVFMLGDWMMGEIMLLDLIISCRLENYNK